MRYAFLILIAFMYYSNCLGQSRGGEKWISNALSKQYLHSWQVEVAKKANKNILDYYLLLPKQLLVAELSIDDRTDTREFRLSSLNKSNPAQGRANIKAGFLIASPDAFIKMALFKDRTNNRDILGIVLGCGEPPIQYCDYEFITFDQSSLKWNTDEDVFPWERFYSKCDSISSRYTGTEYFLPNLVLPEFGTTISVVDAWDDDKSVFLIDWAGSEFKIR